MHDEKGQGGGGGWNCREADFSVKEQLQARNTQNQEKQSQARKTR